MFRVFSYYYCSQNLFAYYRLFPIQSFQMILLFLKVMNAQGPFLATSENCPALFYRYDKFCLPCPSKCIKCNQQQCIQCESGFSAQSGQQCKICFNRCSKCFRFTCIQCPTFYNLIQNVCQMCSTYYCVSCTDKICNKCADGYYMNDGNCRFCGLICAECQSQKVCTQCLPIYYLKQGQCLPCNKGCAVCTASSCLVCQYRYKLIDNNCRSCILIDHLCVDCDQTSCLHCYQGFGMIGGKCNRCTKGCLNCNQNVCISCQIGLFPNGRQCQKCQQNCLTCSKAEACLICNTTFYLKNQRCLQCKDINCMVCSQTQCLNCANLMKIKGEYCEGQQIVLPSPMAKPQEQNPNIPNYLLIVIGLLIVFLILFYKCILKNQGRKLKSRAVQQQETKTSRRLEEV